MSTELPAPPRSVVDLQGGQTADVSVGQAANTITNANQGADATEVLIFLKDYIFKADQVRETALKEVRSSIVIMSDAMRSMREQLNDLSKDFDRRKEADAEAQRKEAEAEEQRKEADAQRLLADYSQRRRRQWVLNAWLGAITISVVAMALGWLYLLIRLWPTLTAAAMALGGAR
jgi:hypothetical protein